MLFFSHDSFVPRLSVPAKEGEDRTLPTELQPPPLVENGNHTTVYIINVFAVRNSNESVDTLKNEIVDTVPEMLGKCKACTRGILYPPYNIFS